MTENRTLPHFGDDEAFAARLQRAKPTPEFSLRHSDVSQAKLLDEDVVTSNWPPLPIGPYIPAPRELSLVQRWKLNKARRLGL